MVNLILTPVATPTTQVVEITGMVRVEATRTTQAEATRTTTDQSEAVSRNPSQQNWLPIRVLMGSSFYPLIVASTAPPALTSVTVVTGKAGVGVQRRLMTIPARGAAVIHTRPALIRNARVRTVVRRKPVLRRVAGRAIQPKHPCMEGRITVTTCTGR